MGQLRLAVYMDRRVCTVVINDTGAVIQHSRRITERNARSQQYAP
jgi:hypothetical protein